MLDILERSDSPSVQEVASLKQQLALAALEAEEAKHALRTMKRQLAAATSASRLLRFWTVPGNLLACSPAET